MVLYSRVGCWSYTKAVLYNVQEESSECKILAYICVESKCFFNDNFLSVSLLENVDFTFGPKPVVTHTCTGVTKKN